MPYPQAGSTKYYDLLVQEISKLIKKGVIVLNKGESIRDVLDKPKFKEVINTIRKQAPQPGTGYTRHKQVKLDGSHGRTNKRVRVMGEFSSGGKKFINQKRYKKHEKANKSKLS